MKNVTEDTFNQEVLESKEVVIVDFGAEWCAPCKALNPILEKLANESSLKIVTVDVDDCPNLAKQYGVKGVPTIIIFKDGEVAKQSVGLINKEALLKLADI